MSSLVEFKIALFGKSPHQRKLYISPAVNSFKLLAGFTILFHLILVVGH